MRRVLILLVITVVLIGAGFLSITLSQQAGSTGTGGGVFQVQTNNPDASVLAMTAQKGALLLGLVFLTFALLGGLTTGLTLVTWFLTRQISRVRTAPDHPFSFSLSSTQPNSLGYVLARRPALTVGVSLVALFVVVGFLALLGAFAPR